MPVDSCLPQQELVRRQRVPTAGLFKREQAPTDRCDHLGFASNDPALRVRWRQVGNRQWTAVRPDHILRTWSKRSPHLAYATKTEKCPYRLHSSWTEAIWRARIEGRPLQWLARD